MWFRKLKVCNVGPFADLEINFTRGSVGIFGRNGKGKSTVLNLLYALATNDFSRFDGVKADMVRNTAGPKDKSFIRGEIEHNGKVLDITRNMKPTKTDPNTTLVIDGAAPITNADKAEEEINKVLGIDRKLLDLYVFKEQHKVYDFLTTGPAERAKAYQVLCRTEDCEKIWDMLGEFLNKDKEVNVEIVDNSDELTQAIAELNMQLEAIAEQKKAAAEQLCEDKYLDRYKQRVKDADRLAAYEEEKLEVEGDITTGETLVKKRKKTLDAAKEELDEVQAKFDKRKTKADDTRAALKSWEAYRQYRKQRKRLNDEKDSLAIEGEQNVPPVPVDNADKLEAWKKTLLRTESDLEQAQKVVAAFQVTGRTECPTCKTPVDHIRDHLEEMKKKVKELPAEIAKMEKRIEAVEEYNTAARKYEKWKAGYDARVKSNAASLDSLKTVEAPDGTEDELKEWLAKFEALRDERDGKFANHRGYERDYEKAEDGLKLKKTRLSEIVQRMSELDVEPEKVEKAKKRLAEHSVATNEIATLEGEEKGVRKQIEGKQADLKKLRTKLKRTKKVRQMAKVISEVREVLHRDKLPRKVATTNLARMEGDINDGLGHFGDPFWVETNGELSFTVHKSGEPPQPAGRLSTGQRVILALAFWPAVASLWATDLGMLCLDEPTANLDGENRKFLAQALGAMTAKVRGQRQLIMVTHDPDLRTAFDQVVDLGG